MNEEQQKIVDELLGAEEDLSDWESNFIHSITTYKDRELSDKQFETLEKIYERIFVGEEDIQELDF